MNPARVMQLCAQRDRQMKGREKKVMTALEVELMAPLGPQQHGSSTVTTRSNAAHSNDVDDAERREEEEGKERRRDSSDTDSDDTLRESGDDGSIVRPHRSYRPPSGRGEEEELVCCVCLEGFDNAELVRATRCSHTFHGHCLERWLMRYHSRCPLCQQDLKPSTKVFQ